VEGQRQKEMVEAVGVELFMVVENTQVIEKYSLTIR
jgi:hypothetical protein